MAKGNNLSGATGFDEIAKQPMFLLLSAMQGLIMNFLLTGFDNEPGGRRTAVMLWLVCACGLLRSWRHLRSSGAVRGADTVVEPTNKLHRAMESTTPSRAVWFSAGALLRILFCCIHSFIIYIQQSLIMNSSYGGVLLSCASTVLLPHWDVSGNIRLIGTVTRCGHWWSNVSNWQFICVSAVTGFKSASCLEHAGTGPRSLCTVLWHRQ